MSSVETIASLEGAAEADRWPARLSRAVFASTSDHDRHRRPADVARVGLGTSLVVATALEVGRPVGWFVASTALARSLPDWIATMLGAVLALGGAYVIGLVVLALLVPGHLRLLRDLSVGLVAATVSAVVLARLTLGGTPDVDALWTAGGEHFPELRVVLVTTMALLASPYVVRPVRRLGQTLLVLGAVAGVALQLGEAGAVAGAIGVSLAAAGLVHLAFGSPAGSLSTEQVRGLLASQGMTAHDLVRTSGRRAGASIFQFVGPAERRLTATVFGRDAADLQVAAKVWRRLWYRTDGPFIAGRLRQAEHQALMALLGSRAGAATPELVLVAGTERGDAILVTRQPAGACSILRWTPALAEAAWRQLDALHEAGAVHGAVDRTTFLIDAAGRLHLADLDAANLDAGPAGMLADRAGLLALTACSLGIDEALAALLTVRDPGDLATIAPLLQPAALSPRLRGVIRRQKLDLTELRRACAARGGVELPPLVQLRRVTIRSLLSSAGSVFVVWYLVSLLADVDLATIADALRGSIWAWAVLALLTGLLARLPGAVSVLGASEGELPLGPTWVLQLAITFINLVVPGKAARFGTLMRYYQKQGAEGSDALTASVLDSLGGLVVQIAILIVTLGLGLSTLTFSTSGLDLSLPDARLLLFAAAGVAVGLVVVAAVARLRDWVLHLLRQAAHSVKGLRSARRAGMLFGGNLGCEALSAVALGFCVLAVGHHLPFVDLIAINVVVALFAGLMPIPGGIGVSEAALAVGLSLAGLPESDALAAALLFRLVTFYLPPLWGYVALRWLTSHEYL